MSGTAYFGIAEVLNPLRDVDKWIRRKLRCYHWKQWGRAGYRIQGGQVLHFSFAASWVSSGNPCGDPWNSEQGRQSAAPSAG
jgi:hypothetical protein